MRFPGAALGRDLRSRAWNPLIAAVSSTVLFTGAAQAYRPFDLTDADVANRHNIEIELGPSEFIGVGSEHSLRTPIFSINYGLAIGRELVFEGANHVALKPEPGEQRMHLEGVALALKQVVRRGSLQDEAGLSLATENELLFPERGEKHLGAAMSLIASSATRRGSIHFNVEAARLPEGRNAGSAGLIFEKSDHSGIAPAVELKSEAMKGGPPEHSAIFGLIFVQEKGAEYDLALRLARSGDARIFEIRAGMTWTISGHKLLAKVAPAAGHPHPRRRRH